VIRICTVPERSISVSADGGNAVSRSRNARGRAAAGYGADR
jgi:hypothetical protein